MKNYRHPRAVKTYHPSPAALTPLWELFFLSESFLGLLGSFAGLGFQFLGGITSLVQALADLFGGSSQTT